MRKHINMSKLIDDYISQNNMTEAIAQCFREEKNSLGILFTKICKDSNIHIELDQLNFKKEKVRVLLMCNWCDSITLCNMWNKMSKGDYCWNNIQIVWEKPVDYFVVINCPQKNESLSLDLKKTILFHMEPHMDRDEHIWGEWAKPNSDLFKFCGTHKSVYNNNEWWLSKTYSELCSESVTKDREVARILSTVLSDKYNNPGHIRRVDFVKFLEKKMDVHVYGSNKFEWKNYRGSLPPREKDNAMFPYKYVFNAENHEIRNYYTEKFIDGILAECLIFYWGCPNIRDFFDERAFVKLELINFEQDYQLITRAIEENWWEQRLPYIRAAKNSILNEKQFFPRLESII
jgi:Glycosyltransferase family 10 (fucosyltransferase) C-term